MKKSNNILYWVGGIFLAAFFLWTVLVCFVDVKPIGPDNSAVGFASLNSFFRNIIGVNMGLYTITDWLGLVPIGFALSFAVVGLFQFINRRSFLKVDKDILALGAYYIVVVIIYFSFEYIVINYRPVLINGKLEVSYPSSTTLLVASVMPTAILQLKVRIRNNVTRKIVLFFLSVFTVFMIIGRLISGVHWFSDIVGGVLVSTGLFSLYAALFNNIYSKEITTK